MSSYLPFVEIVAAYDAENPPPAEERGTALGTAFLCSFLGAAFGIIAGLAVGMVTTNAPASAHALALKPAATAATSSASQFSAPPPHSATIQNDSKSLLASMQRPADVKTVQSKPPVSRNHLRHVKKPSRLPVAAPVSTPAVASAVETPQPKEQAPQDAADSTTQATFYTEGDVTVADFDASASGGKIDTYEGSTFAIADASVPGNPTFWDDVQGSSLHYRCDQSSNCTLMSPGIAIQNVKLMRL